jgi:hypothetical protein
MTLSDFDAAPFVVSSETVLDAPIEAVWVELGDPSGWFPMMSSCTWNGRVGGVGSSRDVHVRTFGTFREEMIVWDVDKCVAFTMTTTTSPLVARMGEEFAIARVGDRTRLNWRMVGHLTAPGRVLRPVLKVAVGQMAKIAAKRLARRAAASGNVRGTHAS